MVYGKQQLEVRAYRGQIPSPGRPTVAWREDRVRFWAAIAAGAMTEDAATEAGVSSPVGFRWFRHAGGVNPRLQESVSGRYLSSVNVKISPCGVPRGPVFVKLLAGWAVRRRRSRVSCAVTPRHVPTGSTTRHRSRSGMPSGARGVRRPPSSSATTGCASTSRTSSPVWFVLLTARLWPGPPQRRIASPRRVSVHRLRGRSCHSAAVSVFTHVTNGAGASIRRVTNVVLVLAGCGGCRTYCGACHWTIW